MNEHITWRAGRASDWRRLFADAMRVAQQEVGTSDCLLVGEWVDRPALDEELRRHGWFVHPPQRTKHRTGISSSGPLTGWTHSCNPSTLSATLSGGWNNKVRPESLCAAIGADGTPVESVDRLTDRCDRAAVRVIMVDPDSLTLATDETAGDTLRSIRLQLESIARARGLLAASA